MSIIDEIKTERTYQDQKWGTTFDDKNTINDWVTYITQYATKAVAMGISKDDQRKFLLKTATLGVAALETFDRNKGFAPRHYDNA